MVGDGIRVQFRMLQTQIVHSISNPFPQRISDWSAWQEWPEGHPLSVMDFEAIETRIVNQRGEVIKQTPPFKPAYYQRRKQPDGNPGGITWCTSLPDSEYWIRRDDIKPR